MVFLKWMMDRGSSESHAVEELVRYQMRLVFLGQSAATRTKPAGMSILAAQLLFSPLKSPPRTEKQRRT